MASVNFLYRSRKRDANLSLRLLYRHDKKDFTVGGKTKYLISKEYWIKKHPLKRIKDIDIANKQTEVNQELNKIENHILEAFNRTHPDNISKEWLQDVMDDYYKPSLEPNRKLDQLLAYYKDFIEFKKNEITSSTIKKYKTVQNLLERYENTLGRKLLIKDIDLLFQKDFENYCLSKSYSKNTIAKAVRTIKTVCNHAKYNGIETSYQLEKLKPKFKKVENIYLTFEEIEQIENLEKADDIDPKELTESILNARDWLVISCYTGQRVSDFMRFNKDMIRVENGKPLIEFTQKKTNKTMTVPLHKKVLDILEKRNGKFPRPISDQKYNDYIKDVCELAKIDNIVRGSKKQETFPKSKIYRKIEKDYKKYELVSSHIGRRSFATNFYGQIPTSYLIYVTGHSTEKMFLQYIGKSNKDLALELTKYF
ncbi:tyrosine-type recombinase/integrase [Mangrovimonas xylaniphaga]|uniref:tyrosine-type recombinase/integrase n=1 Tax=Mangrovimonas xylaniphaga TaxID=1645915 RepID=UPI0006B48F47|nr:site-specific integrase [Mangrovimonas xylaniphaga]